MAFSNLHADAFITCMQAQLSLNSIPFLPGSKPMMCLDAIAAYQCDANIPGKLISIALNCIMTACEQICSLPEPLKVSAVMLLIVTMDEESEVSGLLPGFLLYTSSCIDMGSKPGASHVYTALSVDSSLHASVGLQDEEVQRLPPH